MFNTPFASNAQFTPFGFNNWNPAWNKSFSTPFWGFGAQSSWNSFPWSNANTWNWTPWNWNQSFNGFQGFNGFNPFWNQTPAWNWFNSPAAFSGQFPTQFGFNWWNNENAQSEAGAPFAYAPFSGFNPNAAPVNQAA